MLAGAAGYRLVRLRMLNITKGRLIALDLVPQASLR